jgi:hypothetical protein
MGAETIRVEGWVRDEWEAAVGELASTLGIRAPPVTWAEFPVKLEGCGSKHGFLDQTGGNLVSRAVIVGDEDDVFEFMSDSGFTDGLPVVPPTPARVARMLKGTFRDPSEIIALVPPMMGAATVEKVAVNAVMAGAKPSYMPVILAALEAICTDDFNCHGVWATTMSAAPVMIINGPIRSKIGASDPIGRQTCKTTDMDLFDKNKQKRTFQGQSSAQFPIFQWQNRMHKVIFRVRSRDRNTSKPST